MNLLDRDLAQRLATLSEQGLLRELRPIDSQQSLHIKHNKSRLIIFSSIFYLVLANHPQ